MLIKRKSFTETSVLAISLLPLLAQGSSLIGIYQSLYQLVRKLLDVQHELYVLSLSLSSDFVLISYSSLAGYLAVHVRQLNCLQ